MPTAEQSVEAANGSLEYLEYLKEGYAPAHQGPPTATSYPRWDLIEAPRDARLLSPGGDSASSGAEGGQTGGLCVEGLPVWALQFQIGLLAFRLGQSARAMAVMEGSFLSYETWLPRYWDYGFGLHLRDCSFFYYPFYFPAQMVGGLTPSERPSGQAVVAGIAPCPPRYSSVRTFVVIAHTR